MDKSEFDKATLNIADQAWHSAMLFELLSVAYSAIARGRFDEWQDVLIKLSQLPKDDLMTSRVRDMHETVCDMGWSDELSRVTSELAEALDPFPQGA